MDKRLVQEITWDTFYISLGIGGGILLLVIVGVMIYCLIERRRRREEEEEEISLETELPNYGSIKTPKYTEPTKVEYSITKGLPRKNKLGRRTVLLSGLDTSDSDEEDKISQFRKLTHAVKERSEKKKNYTEPPLQVSDDGQILQEIKEEKSSKKLSSQKIASAINPKRLSKSLIKAVELPVELIQGEKDHDVSKSSHRKTPPKLNIPNSEPTVPLLPLGPSFDQTSPLTSPRKSPKHSPRKKSPKHSPNHSPRDVSQGYESVESLSEPPALTSLVKTTQREPPRPSNPLFDRVTTLSLQKSYSDPGTAPLLPNHSQSNSGFSKDNLSAFCASCGKRNPGDHQFCTSCGHNLTKGHPIQSGESPTSSPKVGTIRNFQTLQRQRGGTPPKPNESIRGSGPPTRSFSTGSQSSGSQRSGTSPAKPISSSPFVSPVRFQGSASQNGVVSPTPPLSSNTASPRKKIPPTPVPKPRVGASGSSSSDVPDHTSSRVSSTTSYSDSETDSTAEKRHPPRAPPRLRNKFPTAKPRDSRSESASQSDSEAAQPNDAVPRRFSSIIKNNTNQLTLPPPITPRGASHIVHDPEYEKRYLIGKELFETEKTYFNSLMLLDGHFSKPLQVNWIIDEESVKIIFPDCLHTIISISAALMEGLEPFLEMGTGEALLFGPTLSKIIVLLKQYSLYINNYDQAVNLVTKLKKTNPVFANFMQEKESDPICNATVESLLITVVQRIPRLVLLIQDLLKHTPHDHPDFAPLTEAAAKIREVATYINEERRKYDLEQYSKKVHKEYGIKGGETRTLLWEEKIWKESPDKIYEKKKPGKDPRKPHKLFLFSDMVCIAKIPFGKFDTVKRIPLTKPVIVPDDAPKMAFQYNDQMYYTENPKKRKKLLKQFKALNVPIQ